MAVKSVLMVCMGNICRSPTAEAVLRAKAQQRGVIVEIDSAGTIANHTGNSPDPRAMKVATNRGYGFDGIKARKVTVDDFERFDLILAADNANMQDLRAICPTEHQAKLQLLLSAIESEYLELPDPYYGGAKGFELVLDLVELAADAWLDRLDA